MSLFHFCPNCGPQPLTVPRSDVVICPRCQYRDTEPASRVFGSAEWDASTNPHRMMRCFRALGNSISLRKRRLILCDAAHMAFPSCRTYGFREAVAAGEEWAETSVAPAGAEAVRQYLMDLPFINREERGDWVSLGIALLSVSTHDEESEQLCNAFLPVLIGYREVVAQLCRELFANPFVPLEWNPEWFTSTVRDLAAHIYEKREFHLMPVLGDALMDAGCDHQLIQDHCRSSKPHARGCWVVDAILGKT